MSLTESDIVHIDVGGRHFATSRTVIQQGDSGFLKKLLADSASNELFIDRDGTNFRYIMSFMRSETPVLPNETSACNDILKEAEFFETVEFRRLVTQHGCSVIVPV